MDKTVIKPAAPEFKVNDIVYARASAIRGYVEQLMVANIEYKPSINTYVYHFWLDIRQKTLQPIWLRQDEIITLKDALTIQLSVLQGEYDKIKVQIEDDLVLPTIVAGEPLYGMNETVYLRETSEVAGRLESYVIDGLRWEESIEQWVYKFVIKSRPEAGAPIMDRINGQSRYSVEYPEEALCGFGEALQLAESFLRRAITAVEARLRASGVT